MRQREGTVFCSESEREDGSVSKEAEKQNHTTHDNTTQPAGRCCLNYSLQHERQTDGRSTHITSSKYYKYSCQLDSNSSLHCVGLNAGPFSSEIVIIFNRFHFKSFAVSQNLAFFFFVQSQECVQIAKKHRPP